MNLAELGGRIRMAQAYAGLKNPELERLTGIKHTRLAEIKAGRSLVTPAELRAIAEICGLPLRVLLRDSWEEPGEEDAISALDEVADLLEDAARESESQHQEPDSDD